MIIFNLKREHYKDIEAGRKTHEYRKFCEYWKQRIGKLRPGSKIQFRFGYTKETLVAKVLKTPMIKHHMLLPNDVQKQMKEIYGQHPYFYDIEFALVGDDT